MRNSLTQLAIVAIVVAACLAAPARAGEFAIRDGGVVDAKTLLVQEKAEELFQRGDFDRAYFIYRNELAPIGDKYAQYMLGFMTLTGSGVSEDAVMASAWYRLAAERNVPEFVEVRDQLLARMDDVDLARSDVEYRALRRELSDIVLYMRLARRDHEALDEGSIGSRIGGPSSAVTIVRPGEQGSMSGDAYQQQLRRSLRRNLDRITSILGIRSLDVNLSDDDLDDLERQVLAYVDQVDDR